MYRLLLIIILLYCFSNIYPQALDQTRNKNKEISSHLSIGIGAHYNAYFGKHIFYPNTSMVIDPGVLGDRDSIMLISEIAPNGSLNYNIIKDNGIVASLGVRYMNRKEKFQCYGDSLSLNPTRAAIIEQHQSNHGISFLMKIGYNLDRFAIMMGCDVILFEFLTKKSILSNNEIQFERYIHYKKLNVSQRFIPVLALSYNAFSWNKYNFNILLEGQMREINYYDFILGITINYQ